MRFLATTLVAAAGAVLADSTDPPAEKLQVHIIPHTHDDIGWLKTVHEYDRGLNQTIQFVREERILGLNYRCNAVIRDSNTQKGHRNFQFRSNTATVPPIFHSRDKSECTVQFSCPPGRHLAHCHPGHGDRSAR
jgi:hypothetical protein